jgi:hypothetical protein
MGKKVLTKHQRVEYFNLHEREPYWIGCCLEVAS